jgi:hypothetical protein
MARTAFESLPDSQDASAPETDSFSDSFFKEPSKLSGGEAAQAPPIGRQRSVTNRIRAEDLAARGIPSYRNASGDVSAVRDESGAALTGFQQKAGIAYDSKGQPKQISYDETGPPKISDPFDKIPARTDPKTGAIEKNGPGGIYQYLGQDPDVTAKVAQKASDKDLSKESSLLGRKLSLDEHDMVQGTKQQKGLHEDLMNAVPTLRDPKFHGADQETVKKAIDEHFDAQYGAPEANKTSGFFSSELSSEAKGLRANIDAQKAKAYASAEQIFDLNDKLSDLHDNIQSGRSKERAQVETLLAHQQGGKGPLDQQQAGETADQGPQFGPASHNASAQSQIYPPEEDWSRMLGGKDAVAQVQDRIARAEVPPTVAPAVLAATNDAQDAKAKAEELKDSDPKAANAYKNFAASIVNGIAQGVGELFRNPALNKGEMPGGNANPLNWGPHLVEAGERKVFGKAFSDLTQQWLGHDVPDAAQKLVDDRLKDSIGTKAGNFIGGIAPYVAAAIATKGTSVATPLLSSMFYASGYQRTVEDAQSKGKDPNDPKIQAAAVGVGAINAVLAMPLRTVGKAVEAVFGDTAPKIITRAITNAYEQGGPEAVGGLLGKLAESIKSGGAGAEKLRTEAVEGIQRVMAEIQKPAAQRIADVGKTALQHAALGAGVQTAENLTKKTYNPNQGTFEGVPEQALGFGALGALSEGFKQVADARKAKQALDIINSKKGPPSPESPGGLAGKPTAPKGGAPALTEWGEKSNEQVSTSTKGGKAAGPSASEPARPESKGAQPDNANAAGKEIATRTETATAKTGSVLKPLPEPATMKDSEIESELKGIGYTVNKAEPGEGFTLSRGDRDNVEPKEARAQSLAEELGIRTTGTRPETRIIDGKKVTTPPAELTKGPKIETIDVGAHEAATSPKNGLPEPSGAQKQAGNYQKGHITVGGLDISIENPAGSKRKAHFDALQSHYGYVKGTVGADKDHVDIFVKKGTPTDWNGPVFVVNQHNAAGKFDEHKAVIGVNTPEEAKAEYLKNYQKGWTGGKSLAGFKNPAAFKQWAQSGAKGQPATLTQSERASAAVSETSRTAPVGAGKEVSETSRTEKLVQGAMAKHKETLTALGHPLTVKPASDVSTQLGIGVHIERSGTAQILVDHAKLAKETAGFSDREKSRTIQRAIDEEVMHLGALKWEKKAPENTQKLKEWGAADDEIGKHLSKAYSGWEGLSDRQKGHEKVRAVLQKRWTGRLTETARAALRGLMEFFRNIYDKLTAGQKEIVDGIESVLKGEKISEIAPERPEIAKKGSKLQERANELTTRFEKFTNAPATESTVIRTLLKSGSAKALDQAEAKIEKLEDKNATTAGKQQSGKGTELSRVSPRQDVRADTSEVRKSEGAKTDAGGGTVERGAPSEKQKPGVGQSGQLDAKANKAVDEAFEGLFAGKPKGEPTTDAEFASIQAPHRVGVEAGLKLPPAEVENLKRQLRLASEDMIEAASKRSDRFQAAFGKQTYLAGKLEGAQRKGPNFEAYLQDGGNRFDIQRERKFLDDFAVRNGYSSFAGLEASSPQMGKQGRAEFKESQQDRIVLGAAIPQESIPVDKLPKVITAAQELIRSGIDTPEKLASVLEEKFAGKARPFSQGFWDAVGIVRPDLRGTHDWQAIYAAHAPEQKKTELTVPEGGYKGAVRDIVRDRLEKGEPVDRKLLTMIARNSSTETKEADEQAEEAIVAVARKIAGSAEGQISPVDTFDKMVDLYDRQPNLTAKTSTSKVNQAYSTPAPLAYAASRLADIAGGKSIFEPTAGNGILLIEADPKSQKVWANELDSRRAEALKKQDFGVTSFDAAGMTTKPSDEKVDRVIANPPFGTVLENNETKIFPLWDSETKQIDFAIAARALDAMTDDGRAVLILGGKNIKDPEERAKAYATPNQANFWKPLYDKYKVVDHFTVDGDLYSKQGAGWPVDVVVIAGRGKSPIQLPSAEGPRIIASWDGLRDELSRSDQDRIEAGRYDAERDREKLGGIVDSIRGIAGTEQRVGPEGSAEPVDAGDGTRGGGKSVTAGRSEQQSLAERRATETGNEVAAERAGAVGARDADVQPEQRGSLGQFRVPYKPASKSKSFGIFVPTNMEVPAREALAKLQERVGPIDDFVRAQVKLKDGSLSAEQLDALALAIDAIDGKTAFVLGDQGGVGKGRVAGAMIAWAVDHKQTPIFVTKDEKLYAAMIEDLHDIGREDVVPLMTNSDISFEDYAGQKWAQGKMHDTMKEVARTGQLPEGNNVLFTSYYQIQKDFPKGWKAGKAERAAMKAKHMPPPDGARMEALKRLAPGSIIIADESHLASGDSITAWRLAPLLEKARGVYYSSATFAKRPDSMGIYSRTSLSHATQSMDDLIDAMKQGGVPLQQVVSSTLASDGLYMRRERDFSKAIFRTHVNVETRDRDVKLADNYTYGLRTILAISNKMKAASKQINRVLRRDAKQMHLANAPRLESTNFAAKLHNLVSQYLFAIKAESAVRRAVEGLTKGFTNAEGETVPHKVVIAFQNTMQEPILDLENGGRPLNFNGMLLRYLDSQRVLTSGTGENAKQVVITDKGDPEFDNYTDQMLQKIMIIPTEDPENPTVNQAAVAELFRRLMSGIFKAAEERIEGLDLADMPISPIDYLRHQLALAGIKVGEITGRSIGVDEDGQIYKINPRSHSKAAHLRTLNDFNNGDIGALLMNESGSTGISAHASEKFKSQEPRAMLILQPHLDINAFMQTLWRIDRTGQVHQPYYENVQTALSAELRPAAILNRKMGSLNANTTSNAENEVSAGNNGVDIFNQYGDEVVYNYLKSDSVFTAMLDFPKIMDGETLMPFEDVMAQYEEDGRFAAAISGRVAVLAEEEAGAFWDKVQADYVALIDYLNELGQNELLADTIDMKAETLESKELTPAVSGKGRASGFDQPSYLEKIKADIGSKPLPANEVVAAMDALGEKAYTIGTEWREKASAWKNAELLRLAEKVVGWTGAKDEQYLKRWRDQEEEISQALDLIGSGLHLQDKTFEGYGAITAVRFDDEHPLTPSRVIFTVAVNTTKKTLQIPASKLPSIARMAVGEFADLYEGTAERSNTRYMVTGNLLSAYLAIRDAAPTAKIVQYTNDKGELRQGILMPNKFAPGALQKKRVVENASHMRTLLDAGRTLTNGDGAVTLMKPSSEYVMRVPSNKTMGGAFWRDSELASLMQGGEFIQRSSGIMMGKFTAAEVPKVFQRLLDLGASLFFTEQESETLGAGKPQKAPMAFYKDDVESVAKNIGLTVKESLTMLRHLVAPASGVHMEARDRAMKMLGERNQKAYETDRVLEGWRQAIDKWNRPEQIAFVDRMKEGKAQPSPELQELANTLRKIDTESWEAARDAYVALGFKDKEVPLAWLDNHFRVLWKKIPGDTKEEKSAWIGKARRGLRGSMGQHKQHTLENMSDGLAMGGVPYTYNFVEMFKLAQADLWKLTTTLRAWKWAKENHFVEFVKGPFPKAPDGMVPLDDSIAKVYFPAESGEGLVVGGQYFVEEGFGRLLNNYLSTDHIRAVKLGRGLIWIKNATTALELSLSPFHAIFETLDAVGSNIGLGLQKLVNRGILGGNAQATVDGIKDMITAAATPITHGLGKKSLGAQIRLAAANPTEFFKTADGKKMLKAYPRAKEMIDDLFSGGWKPTELEQDWRTNSIRSFVDSVSDIKAGASDNYIGAGLRAFPAANEMLMRPLFDYYIPNLKVAQFFKEYAEALEQNERKLKGGILTRAALARQTWRFVEDRFGEMNYDTIFWNRTFKSAMQLMFRSVTWKLGSVSAFAGAFGGQGKEFIDAFKERRAPELHRNMAWLFGMMLLTATLGAIIQQVFAHKPPGSLTDLVFPQLDPKDDKIRGSLPTYWKDLIHLIHAPTSYVTSSMSGWVGRVADLFRNKDYYGVQIHDNDDPILKQALAVGEYLGQTLLPFSIRGYKNLSANDVGGLRKAIALMGVQPAPRYIGQTPAERKASEYWQGQRSEAGIRPDQLEHKQDKRMIVSQIEHGHAPNLSQALAKGTIKPGDVKSLYHRASMGQLASSVLHMPLADAERIYKSASLKERAVLEPVMAQKRANVAKRNRPAFSGF